MQHPTHAQRCRDEHGATSTEYALLVTLIAMMIFTAVGAFGIAVGGLFDVPFP